MPLDLPELVGLATLSAQALRSHGRTVALEGIVQAVNYLELAERTETIAAALHNIGVRAGDCVALLSMGRAHDEAIGLVGILLAGAVVVPLDHSSPPLRLATIAKDSGCRAVVHDATALKLVGACLTSLARVELDGSGVITKIEGVAAEGSRKNNFEFSGEGSLSLARRDDEEYWGYFEEKQRSQRRLAPLESRSYSCASPKTNVPPNEALSFILHTSGSTGKPKAVAMTRAGVTAFVDWMLELTQLCEGDRVLRVAELVFDLSLFDHLATFSAGATLCTMSRRDVAAGRSFAAAITRLRPNLIYGVPALFSKLVHALPDGRILDECVRMICFAGEVFPPAALKELANRSTARMVNLFGPTETNVCTFYEVVRSELDGESALPIGKACPYAECWLVADDGSRIDGDGVGELMVRGPTALGGEFATRDRVKKHDGLFYFCGRMDRMLKIRGFRIEPGEVEAALQSHPSVREAAVEAWQHPRLGLSIRGFVALLTPSKTLEPRTLRKYVAERLASYMVPEAVHIVDALPRTSTGKIDYPSLGGCAEQSSPVSG